MKKRPVTARISSLLFASLLLCTYPVQAQDSTRVIILGTGTPVPDARRSGPGVAILTKGQAYVFDAGGGMVQRAVQASEKYRLPELNPQNINHLFITHIHSDHIHDVAELASSRWWGRQQRLKIWGPRGMAAYVDNMNAMAAIEAGIRSAGTPPQLITDTEGYLADITEIEPGLVFSNPDIRVEAFTVAHGEIKPAFGYKVTTADKTIVISGDTTYSPALAAQAKGADLLIHEVISGDRLSELSTFWQQYHGSSHTTATQVAQIANSARPGLLVLYHVLFIGATAADIVAEVTRNYDGKVVLADDLDSFQ
ncbi:MAG: MBL fold metallo-hydrolase [Pseudomonadales bacterium]|nr:MBL fold metallo-hydrolase [Pseudomonadales bacterium]